jgi:triacylglycerol esterase/lipase EstA (alpha/beta hydrolase family)
MPLATDRSNKSKRPDPSGSVATAAVSEPEPAVTAAPHSRSARPSVDNAPPTSNAAAVVPASDPVVANQPQLGLQVAGLVTDAGTVALSAIHTVANSVAQAFGQHSFLGVPYLLATTVANAAAAVGRTLVGGSLIDPAAGPFTVNYGILDGLGFFNPTKPPAGANDPSIGVTPEHPLPVILINGTIATQGENWSVGAPVLANAGYKVYSFNYGNVTSDPNFPIQSTDDIRQSGLELAAEVDRVLAETGAPKVILIGHSQGGGILPVYYINNLGGAAKVSQLIGIAPSNHGTDLDGLIGLQSLPFLGPLFLSIADVIGPALYQQAVTSPFQQEVYGDGDTRAGVLYTTIASMNDEVVTPYTQQALHGPKVTNIVLQDSNPGLAIGHANIITSPLTWAAVLAALADNPAANPLRNPNVVAA